MGEFSRTCSDLPASILSAAAKCKSQNCRSGLRNWRSHVQQRAMRWPLGFPARDGLASALTNENQECAAGRLPPGENMKSPICDMLGIEFPLFAFSHCRDVVAAVS